MSGDTKFVANAQTGTSNEGPAPDRARSYEEKFSLLNELTVTHWCNVQNGQPVLLLADAVHAGQVEEIAQFARRLRNSEVRLHLIDREKDLARINSDESLDSLREPDAGLQELSSWIVESKGALIRISGDKDPTVFEGANQDRVQAMKSADSIAMDSLTQEVMAGRMNRCVIASATDGWAKDLGISKEQLQEEIFEMCALNAPNPSTAFLREDYILEAQRMRFQALEIEELTFEGPNLNLKVGLSSDAIWLGGKKHTTDDRNIEFYANVPIGEIFTSPDWTKTMGIV
nr:aminopeptidase [Chloroflexota bacterium]